MLKRKIFQTRKRKDGSRQSGAKLSFRQKRDYPSNYKFSLICCMIVILSVPPAFFQTTFPLLKIIKVGTA